MGFLQEIVFEVIIGFLFVYPGALLRWLFFGRKQKFDSYVQKGDVYNFIISFCLIGGIGIFCAAIL